MTSPAFSRATATPRDYTDAIKAQFDRLYLEGAENGQVMCLPLHPFLIGQPHRMRQFEEALDYVTSHDKVWLATGREIAGYYLAHHYDAFAAAIDAPQEGVRRDPASHILRIPATGDRAWIMTATPIPTCSSANP